MGDMEIQLTKSEDMSSDTNAPGTNAPGTNAPGTNAPGTDIMGMKPDTFCMLLHLSQLLNGLLPSAGTIVPIVLWAMKKDESPLVDQHGKIILNWFISCLIYVMVSFVLLFVFVGILLLPVIAILAIVFPIIGAVKANDGIMWKYPLSIPFFK